jgi:serine protease Do
MKRIISNKIWMAGALMLAVPATVLAQKDKEEKDRKDKEKTENIVITRTGDFEGKTIIEIDGDKIKVNGKDVKDSKEVRVHRNTFTTVPGTYSRIAGGADNYNFNFDWDDHGVNLFTEDANRAMLGVTTREHDKGAEIVTITDESGAEKAGLKKGDVLTKVGDTKIENTGDVTKAIKSHKPGDKVAITYLRDGKEQKATAELSKWKGIRMNAVTMPKMDWDMNFEGISPSVREPLRVYGMAGRPKLGLSLQDAEDGKGVKVLEVDEESNAAKAGIKKDDVITEVDGKTINSTDEVVRTVRTYASDKTSWNFKIVRDGKSQNIEVRIPRKLKTVDL